MTRYWIGIKEIDLKYKSLLVDGLHLGELAVKELSIYIDSIVSSAVLDGTYCPVNQTLVRDIRLNPEKYRGLFDCVPNLQILNYLCDCNRLDATPGETKYYCRLYIDQNGDGRHTDNEEVSDLAVIGGENGQLTSGTEYKVQRILSRKQFSGIVPWKLQVVIRATTTISGVEYTGYDVLTLKKLGLLRLE